LYSKQDINSFIIPSVAPVWMISFWIFFKICSMGRIFQRKLKVLLLQQWEKFWLIGFKHFSLYIVMM
jgi:hypothetical protein